MASSKKNTKTKTDIVPWLKIQLNSGKYPRVVWTTFSIPWKHRGNDDISEAKMYKAWAKACGKDTADGKGTDGKKKPWKNEFNKALKVFEEVSDHKVFRWPEGNPNPKPPKPPISWVKKQIGKPKYPGVVWTNPECTEFSIPWKQGKYSKIFEDWSKVGLGPKGQASEKSYWKNRFDNYLKVNGFKTVTEERVFRWPGQGGSSREEDSSGSSGEEDSSGASGEENSSGSSGEEDSSGASGEEDSSGASGGEESVEGLEKRMEKLKLPRK